MSRAGERVDGGGDGGNGVGDGGIASVDPEFIISPAGEPATIYHETVFFFQNFFSFSQLRISLMTERPGGWVRRKTKNKLRSTI